MSGICDGGELIANSLDNILYTLTLPNRVVLRLICLLNLQVEISVEFLLLDFLYIAGEMSLLINVFLDDNSQTVHAGPVYKSC